MFSFAFLCKFSCICNIAIFVRIFMKFSPKCRNFFLEVFVNVNHLVKLAQVKSVVRLTDHLNMTIAVDLDIKHQTTK